MKLPAFQFYPADWRKDPGVQSLDFFARGIWFEIICLMHESDRRGVLLLNGKAMPISALARLLGITEDLLNQNLTTLEAYGVVGREEKTGALLCRRMVRDEHIRQVRAEAGKQGGNPVLLKQKRTTGVKQIPTPSSSTTSSLSSSSSIPCIDRVRGLFRMKSSTSFDKSQEKAWREAKALIESTDEESWRLLEWAYSQNSGDASRYRRQNLDTLLNHWNGEIEKSRGWKANPNGNGTNGHRRPETAAERKAERAKHEYALTQEQLDNIPTYNAMTDPDP